MSKRNLFLWVAAVAALGAIYPASDARAAKKGYYFCTVASCDGSMSVRQMYHDDISDLRKDLKERYKGAHKEWLELKVKWIRAVGAKPFPVPEPKTPKVRRRKQVPLDRERREKDTEKYRRELEKWNVCIVKDHKGKVTVDTIRRDKMYAREHGLQKAYAEAVIELAEARKENPDAEVDPKDIPVRPVVKVVNESMASADLAKQFAEKLAKKLEMEQKGEKQKKGIGAAAGAPNAEGGS